MNRPTLFRAVAMATALTSLGRAQAPGEGLTLNELDYFEAAGLNVLAFSNPPGGMFFDAKTSGIEIVLRGERTATNGDLRLLPTPEQWDGMGELVNRSVEREEQRIVTSLAYPEHDFSYRIVAQARGENIQLSVELDAPLPAALEGKAGFNLEFLPSAYFGKAYLMDGASGLFPRHPPAQMVVTGDGLTEPSHLAEGGHLVLSPEDPERRVSIRDISGNSPIRLYDGRAKAQNGWFVARSAIPSGQSGTVIQWELSASIDPSWLRAPVIGHSQIGYHPTQPKVAVIELDKNAPAQAEARLWRIADDGSRSVALEARPEPWGNYLRYQYLRFDFSEIRQAGLYQIEYDGQSTHAFPIDPHAHDSAWHLTLDVFFPVQMDHMKVREAYRVWHGASHLDDALQAPPNYEHFDLYAHGEETDTDFAPFEHIPGLNYGGWYDAGDYDIRTQTQYYTVQRLVHAWEQFQIDRDNTTVSQERRYAEIHRPDGFPDLLQQIEHGTLALIAQHRAIGHAIPGIVEAHLYQYPHLGDGMTKTDNKIYDADLDAHADQRSVGSLYLPSTVDPTPNEDPVKESGNRSGRFDDRWAFTTNTTPLNYGSAAALAAASRALRGYNDELAEECLQTAQKVWAYEDGREPNLYRFGNTTGGRLEEEQLSAAVELLLATRDPRYAAAVDELLPAVSERFAFNAFMLVLALPSMGEEYAAKLRDLVVTYQERTSAMETANPYGVPITEGGWAGSGAVVSFGVTNYLLHKAFPDLVEKKQVFRAFDYILGLHPDSNHSFVSGLGAVSRTNAYGMNRADFSFVPGGVVPGVLILPPDLPENKSDWPFFWGQNEYVVNVGANYLLLAAAVQALHAEE